MTLLFRRLITSLIPFVFGYYGSLSNSQSSQISLLDSLRIGSNYLTFLLMMIILETLIQIIGSRNKLDTGTIITCPSGFEKQKNNLKNTLKTLFHAIMSFTLIFIAYQTIGLLIISFLKNEVSSSLNRIKEQQSSLALAAQEEISDQNLHGEDFLGRILEEKELTEETQQQQKGLLSSVPASQILQKEVISLSMGESRGEVNEQLNTMILIKDQKIAFGIAQMIGTLKVFDISNVNSPKVIGKFNSFRQFTSSGSEWNIQALALSSDERVLFISNFVQLAIVNVTNPKAPELIFDTKGDDSLVSPLKMHKVSLEIDESGEILFIGGQGLLVYNISNLQEPRLLKNFTSTWNSLLDEDFNANEIKLSPNKQFLLHADKDLKIYNVSDPNDIRLIASLDTSNSAGSLRYTSNPSRILLLGESINTGIKIDEVDVSNYSHPLIIKSHQFDYKMAQFYHFIASSPGQTRYYISGFNENKQRIGLLTFDDITKTLTTNLEILNKEIHQLEFLQEGKFLLTNSNNQIRITELLKNYPNSEIFESTTRKTNSFSLSLNADWKTEIFPDGKTMVFARRSISAPYKASIEIWEADGLKVPFQLSSLDVTGYLQGAKSGQSFYGMSFASDYKKVYLLFNQCILLVDISDRSSPKVIKSLKNEMGTKVQQPIRKLLMTSDEKSGVGLIFKSVVTFGFSEDSGEMKQFWTCNKTSSPDGGDGGFKALLKDDETLIVVGRELTIYNISDIQSPVEIASVPINKNKIVPKMNEVQLSPDRNMVYLQIFDDLGEPFRLQIYNISVLSSPQLMAEHIFYKTDASDYAYKKKFIRFTSDFNTGFINQGGSLLKIQLSNEKISGMTPHYNNIDDRIRDLIVSPDGHTIYAATQSDLRTINIITAHSNHTLYLTKEKFALGQKYSEHLKILRLNKMFDYDLISDQDSYKLLKLSLLEIKFSPNNFRPDSIESPVPLWIQFDPNRKILTFEPSHRNDLGKFTLQASIALQIPDNAFDSLGVDSEDLLVWLTALNYVDNRLFLGENFVSLENVYVSGGGLGKFRLPKEFRPYKEQIFEILRKFYVKVGTAFEVVPSLESNWSNKSNDFTILTPYSENIKVNIDLISSPESQAQFLHKSYAPLSSVFIENKPKPRLHFEGTLNNINTAMQSVVVDFEKDKDFDANLTINDGLNKPLTISLANASKLFIPNKSPEINNRSIQEQINLYDIYTGQRFTIDFDQKTFKDDWANALTYELKMAKDDTNLPEWLSLNGLKLQGNPPEEVLQDIELVIIAKNEFKETKEFFKIQVKISLVFYLKMALKYGSYIASIVGLLISINKIFNILGKGFYKHPREYTLFPGEKITSEVLPPIYFVVKEKQETKLIIKHLERFVSRELKLKSVSRTSLLDYFIDPTYKQLDKQKLVETVQRVINDIPFGDREKLSYYCSAENSRKPLIQQLIIDQLTLWQLAEDKKTNSNFNSIKKKWTEMVQWDASLSKFVLNQSRFDKIVQERLPPSSSQKESLVNDSDLEDSPLLVSGVNLGLLENAILAYAFKDHQINRLPVKAKIMMKEQIKTNFLKRFFKRDLKRIHKINYGINYEINDDILTFSGITKRNLEGRTLVIQIETDRERILKEIWIRGAPPSSQINQEVSDHDEIY